MRKLGNSSHRKVRQAAAKRPVDQRVNRAAETTEKTWISQRGTRLWQSLWWSALLASLVCLTPAPGQAAGTLPEGESQGNAWVVDPNNPVIKAGDYRDKGLWNDPCVLHEADSYTMYFTTSTDEPFQPPVLPFRAISDDGMQWRLAPSAPLLSAEGTPFVSLETPSVVFFRGRYHMYLTGVYPSGQTPPMAICHAVSRDGATWALDDEPLFSATGNVQDWNGYLVAEPGAVVFDDKILLYFSAIGARAGGTPPQDQTIGLATSVNGKHFTPPRKVLAQCAAYPAERGYVGYSAPAAFVLRERVHLVMSVALFQKGARPEWQQVALHHAVSDNGETDFIQDAAPLFSRENFAWTSGEILAPAALLDENTLKLWFAGHVALDELAPLVNRGWKGGEFGIGFAHIDVESFLTGGE